MYPGASTDTLNNQGVCDFAELRTCDAYADGIGRSGNQLQNAIRVGQQGRFFVGGLVSLATLQDGGMCMPSSSLFTSNGFAAIDLGHMTLPQLATLDLFPVKSVDTDILLRSGYLHPLEQTHLLTSLGLQGSISGHIVPSQLRSLNLYPLPAAALTYERLVQARYITRDCLPTALGISALHIRYISKSSFTLLGCPSGENSQLTLSQLSTGNYVHGRSNLLTPVALAAVRTGHVTVDIFEKLGLYPFNVKAQVSSSNIADLVHAGYLHPNTYLLTGVAFYAMSRGYLTTGHFLHLNLWPCRGPPSMDVFVSAGYATYSGHLTKLGYSLLHAEYFPHSWLSKLGIHVRDDFHIFHHALYYAGYASSDYRRAHSTAVYATDDEADQ